MEVDVLTACAYYPANKRDGDNAKWDSTKFCQAVKSREIKNGYIKLQSGTKIDASNIGYARYLFGNFIKNQLPQLKLVSYCYVPVPSKDSFDNPAFRTLTMLQECLGAAEAPKIWPALAFNQKVERASHKGPRGYDNMLPLITAVRPLSGMNVILVDDIVTSGGTMLACKAIVEKAGGKVVQAIACGRTDEHEAQPWSNKLVRFQANEGLFY